MTRILLHSTSIGNGENEKAAVFNAVVVVIIVAVMSRR